MTPAPAGLSGFNVLDSDALKALIINKHAKIIARQTEIDNLTLLLQDETYGTDVLES